MSCCNSNNGSGFNFHEVYVGFNEDIYNDFYGGKEKDPCCTNNMTSCRDSNGNYSCGGNRNANGRSGNGNATNADNSYQATNKFAYMTCDSTPSNLCRTYDGCCRKKEDFKPSEVYAGFNQNVYLDSNGGSCICPNTDKDPGCSQQGQCQYRY